MKIFTTQLTGLFQSISKDEFAFEDAARLLAQAAAGQGNIYIYGSREMAGLVNQVLESQDPLPQAKPLSFDGSSIQAKPVDRVILATRLHDDEEAVALAEQLYTKNIPFVALSTIHDADRQGIESKADVHIDLKVKRGLIPADDGSRSGYPSLMAALFVIHIIQNTLSELLDELGFE